MSSTQRLPRYLLLTWSLLTLYVCLYPFSGWTDYGVNPFAFVVDPWPKYLQPEDLWLNVAGFLPFGFLFAASLRERLRTPWLLLLGLLAAASLSFGIEFTQNWLPTRVSSNLDLACNTLGGLLGTLAGWRWGGCLAADGAVTRELQRHLMPGRAGEIGLILIGLWWLAQLEPDTALFVSGDLRELVALPPPLAFSASRFVFLEGASVACGVLAMCLLLNRCLRNLRPWITALVLGGGMLLRTISDQVFLRPPDPFAWASSGALRGLGVGLLLYVLVRLLPRWAQHSVACTALLLGTALVNLTPANPFMEAVRSLLPRGHLLNFYGLTGLVAACWPMLALAYLSALAARHDKQS